MRGDIDRVLISQAQIAHRVVELARQITADHAAAGHEEEITLIPVMTGALVFCSDLMRQIPIAMKIGLMTVSSYRGAITQPKPAKFQSQQIGDLTGRHVLLLDDILDSGGTMRLIKPMLSAAASVRTCVLLRKDRAAARDVQVDYVGFDVPDEFVVGYGLDFNDYYRNLPDIVVLKPEVFAGHRS